MSRNRLTATQVLRVNAAPQPATVIADNWRGDAACAGCDADLWFSADAPKTGLLWRRNADHTAVAICASCPVRPQCLTVHAHETHGIFGGLNVEERQGWIRFHRIARPFHHGDEAGAKRHRRAGEAVCHSCLAGARLAAAERSAQLRRECSERDL